jgi:hypothetical protein
MNDDELITALREQRGKVRMTTPVEQIIGRGRAVRARRRVPHVAAALGTAGAAAIAVTAALPASHAALPVSHPARPASHPASGAGAQLAAWTVTRLADGTIQVALRQAADPAGLQRTLRADGVPASVTFLGQQNPACQPYGLHGARKFPFEGKKGIGVVGWSNPLDAYKAQGLLVIHPSALPSGAGLQIAVMRGIPPQPSGPWPNAKGSGHPVLEVFLVKASPQCTGAAA